MPEPMLWADGGRAIMNPRYIRKVVLQEEALNGEPDASFVPRWRVVAYGEGASCVLGTGWLSKEDAKNLLEVAGKLITVSGH